jgi:hypothetical protein
MATPGGENLAPRCTKCGECSPALLAAPPRYVSAIESAVSYWNHIETTVRALIIAIAFLGLVYATFRLLGWRSAVAVWLATQMVQAYQFHYRLPEPIVGNSHIAFIAATLIALASKPSSDNFIRCFVETKADGMCVIPVILMLAGFLGTTLVTIYGAGNYFYMVVEPAAVYLAEPLFRERHVPGPWYKAD